MSMTSTRLFVAVKLPHCTSCFPHFVLVAATSYAISSSCDMMIGNTVMY